MIDEQDDLEIFKDKNALLEGHFILSSGRHSNRYLQSALILQDPQVAEKLGQGIAENFPGVVDTVLSPALGGLIIGHEVARAKKCRAIFSEKDANGKPVLRRGFTLSPNERVLVVEDVVTTGLSTNEVLTFVKASQAKLVGVGCIVNRSGKNLKTIFEDALAVHSLITIDVQSWDPQDCELCKKGVPAIKPGSRKK